ncbi:hypothetical protein M7I_1314 [Glarea lozoyensis 74030]|uniref:Uncharacterized protein n=1 Tax=Glarea lozoyensis (strain ATCC 74030 / MF5533) TaxID=1104152 RepID=H0EFQ8_GLAL7|nr:hypothetical protein M7I_1314 [Glarea lozoyensis 74030]
MNYQQQPQYQEIQILMPNMAIHHLNSILSKATTKVMLDNNNKCTLSSNHLKQSSLRRKRRTVDV